MTDVQPETPGTPDTQATTTKTKDHLGRALSNIATNATDWLGRATAAGDKDYLGRALVA